MTKRSIRTALALGFALAIGAASWAQDATEESFRADLERARVLREKSSWKGALDAYARLFEQHRGRAYVRTELTAIEDDLKVCRFMESYTAPDGPELFGESCKSYVRVTGAVAFDFTRGPDRRSWEFAGDAIVFRHRLDSFTLELKATPYRIEGKDVHRALGIFVGWDPERGSAHAIFPGFYVTAGDYEYRAPHEVLYLKDGKWTQVWEAPAPTDRDFATEYVVKLRGGRISYESGRVKRGLALRGLRDGFIRIEGGRGASMQLEGRIEKEHHRTLLRAHESTAFRSWAGGWDRTKELPEWVLKDDPIATDRPPMSFPGVTGDRLRGRLQAAVEEVHAGDPEAIRAAIPAIESAWAIPPATRHYLLALDAFARGERLAMTLHTAALHAAAPDFGPGLALKGWTLLGARQIDGARAALASAQESAPHSPLTVMLASRLAVFDRDYERAHAVLAEARRRGIHYAGLDETTELIRRTLRGPNWPTKNVVEMGSIRIESDHSEKKCREVGAELERAFGYFRAHFPAAPEPSRKKPTVRVFSSHADYVAYSESFGRDLMHSAGAYIPSTRELVIWVSIGNEDFRNTVRHEGFHWYLHEIVDDAPIWFDEGYAQWFAAVETQFARHKVGVIDARAVHRLDAAGDRLTPLAELLTMTQPAFMANASVHYAQAWALVHMLRKRDPERLARYFAEILTGASAAAAYEKIFAETIDSLQAEYRRYVATLVRASK